MDLEFDRRRRVAVLAALETMTESQALDLLLAGKAVVFPDKEWRIKTGQGRDGLYIWRRATQAEAKRLATVALTAGLPGPAEDVS